MDVGGLLPCPPVHHLCPFVHPELSKRSLFCVKSQPKCSYLVSGWRMHGRPAGDLCRTERAETHFLRSPAGPVYHGLWAPAPNCALVPSLPLGHSFPSHHPLFLILPLPFSGCLVSSIFAQPHCRPPGPAAHSEAAGRSVLRPDWRFLRPAAQTLEPVPLHGHERSLASATPPAAW